MKEQKQRWVLLADVVGSRKITQRKAFEATFSKVVQEANRHFESDLMLPLKGWKGLDEAAAMLYTPKSIYRMADMLNTMLAPEQLRLALVQQEVDIVPDDGDIRSADGPAFHQAAALMLDLKRNGLLFGIKSREGKVDGQLALSVNLLLLLKEGWTVRQKAIYAAYCRNENQDAVAKELSISQQAVSKTLKTVKWSQVQLLENSLQQWLDNEYQ